MTAWLQDRYVANVVGQSELLTRIPEARADDKRRMLIATTGLLAVMALTGVTRGFGSTGPALEQRDPAGTASFVSETPSVLSDSDMAASG